MSRVGKKPINIPPGVSVELQGDELIVKGPKGEEKLKLHPNVKVLVKDNEILVSVKDPEEKKDRALWGLFARLINNQIQGVTHGFEKKLELHGIGFKANLEGNTLVLEVGFSHPVRVELPKGIEATVEKNIITFKGTNKQLVGEIAAQVRAIRKPEPYKGKGIRYLGEIIRRKPGKAAKAAGAAGGK
jgi:large subunit ribosomal protein L6